MAFLSGGSGPSAADSGAFGNAPGGASSGFNPLTSVLGLLPSIIGQNQLGGIAPAFQPGASNFDALGISEDNIFDAIQAIQGASPALSIEDLIGPPQQQGQELAPQVRAKDAVTSMPSVFNTDAQNTSLAPEGSPEQVGPQNIPSGDGLGKIGGFFGNLDQNLQSPSKLLGLSLLSQIDPRLAQAGLFAGGLFGKNKLF